MNIEPIKLLKGSHANTGQTGLGCFMNVIAYLNGEPQITDESPCVCVTVRPIAVWLNDFMTDDERPQLLPFITRAMGSATMDKDTLVRRARLCADYAERRAAWAARAASAASAACAESAESAACAESAESAACAASAASAAWAARAASAACAACAESAARAARAARAASAASAACAESAARAARAARAASKFDYKAFRAELIADTLKLLDDMLPPATDLQEQQIERAQKLIELATA